MDISLFIKLFRKFHDRCQKNQKLQYDKVENSYYSHEAKKLNISSNIIMKDVLQLRKDKEVFNFWQFSTELDGRGSLHIAGDKVYCHEILARNNIPVPRHVVLKSGDYKNAIVFQKKINAPLVIKPARDTGDGAGIFIKPCSNLKIFWAVNYAGSFGEEILVEEYFKGNSYRLLYCKGKFLGASERIPASVAGDGVHTIFELIRKLNENRKEIGDVEIYDPSTRPILYKLKINRELKKVLGNQGLTLNSVPREGEIIQLQNICHWLYGGQYYDVTETISPEIIEIGRKAVQILGIKLAGVDLIAQDIKNPQNGTFVINEVNATPAILVHYEVQNQDKMRPVAKEILKMLFNL